MSSYQQPLSGNELMGLFYHEAKVIQKQGQSVERINFSLLAIGNVS
jgi:hypothetical protein